MQPGTHGYFVGEGMLANENSPKDPSDKIPAVTVAVI